MKARVYNMTVVTGKCRGRWVDVKLVDNVSVGKMFGTTASLYVPELMGWWYYSSKYTKLNEDGFNVVFDEIDDELRNEIYLRLLT